MRSRPARSRSTRTSSKPARRPARVAAAACLGSISTTSRPAGRNHLRAPVTINSIAAMPPTPSDPSGRNQRAMGLPIAHLGVEAGEVVLGHVGGIGHHQVHPADQVGGKRVEPRALGQLQPGGRIRVAASPARSGFAAPRPAPAARDRWPTPRGPGTGAPLHGQGQGDGPRPGAQIDADGSGARPSRCRPRVRPKPGAVSPANATSTTCSVSGRGMRTRRVHRQFECPERPPAEHVLQGLATGPAGGQSQGQSWSPPACSTIQRASRAEPNVGRASIARRGRLVGQRPPRRHGLTRRPAVDTACQPSARRSAHRGRPSGSGPACAGSA